MSLAGNAFMCEYNGLASIGDYAARFTAVKNTVLYAFTQNQLYDKRQDMAAKAAKRDLARRIKEQRYD